MRTAAIASLCLLLITSATTPGRAAPKPVPRSPYLPVVYRYADTMLKHGRDTQGPRKTGLLLGVLDRTTLAPPADRANATPHHDQNLLRVLYTLGELSGKAPYRDAADAELKWLLEHGDAQPAWAQGRTWDVLTDAPAPGVPAAGNDDRSRAWLLWDRCFALAPGDSKRLVLALRSNPAGPPPSARQSGFAIRAFAAAYRHTKDDAFLKAIDAALTSLEAGKEALPAAAALSAAIDCGGAASRVPAPLARRLRAFAARQDQAFCALPHDLKAIGGFSLAPTPATGQHAPAPTPLWNADPNGRTTALVAMMCVSRYENTGDVRYRDLIHAAADAYRNAPPPDDASASPLAFGHAISLQLAAWRSSARQDYLDATVKLADLALQRFWADAPLPRASSKDAHYDNATGADTLALALVELHLSILHITAVRCPPNTIDR